ncbi:carbohydrate porin [Enterobacter hormaechei]|uniref:Carbohydrate porin n=1 Tax=Enterobacter hormaechei TaxID=158836 RepID=A0A4Y5ZTH8_9ENTR|nr:carbohydrate porin [Enterobacter hormaechei]
MTRIEARTAALEQRLQEAETRAQVAESAPRQRNRKRSSWWLRSRKRKPPHRRWRNAPRCWKKKPTGQAF